MWSGLFGPRRGIQKTDGGRVLGASAAIESSGRALGPHSPPSTSARTHVPDTSTNLCNAESVKQRTPHLLFKNILLQKEKKYNAV